MPGLVRAPRVGERLETGMVGIDTGLVPSPAAPFGGVKRSGRGREGGRVGIDEFLECEHLAIPVMEAWSAGAEACGRTRVRPFSRAPALAGTRPETRDHDV